MNLPSPVAFSTIPVAGVFSDNVGNYFLKTDATSGVNLADASVSGGIPPTGLYNYWPHANLALC